MTALPPVSTVRQIVTETVRPTFEAFGDIVGAKQQWASREAIVILTAIGLEESALTYRRQIGGPAISLLMFEKPTMQAVLRHPRVLALPDLAKALEPVGLAPRMPAARIAKVIEANDAAAFLLARLLLWTDPQPLVLDQVKAWETYLRVWRPGKPGPDRWPACWKLANDAYFERGLLNTLRGAGMVVSGAAAAGTAGPAVLEAARSMKEVSFPGYDEVWALVVSAGMVVGIGMTAWGVMRSRQRRTEQA